MGALRVMWRGRVLWSCLVLMGCTDAEEASTPPPEQAPDCAQAAEAIAQCYGQSAATEFSAMCTPERAAEVLPLDCVNDDSKADLVQNNWLCRNLGVLCDTVETFEDDVEHFKYGTLGTENPGLPLALIRALPEICPDLWPEDGWAGFGMIQEPGRTLPIGWSTRRIAGITLASGNCARCHVSTVREAPDADPMIFMGGPGQQIDAVGMTDFQLACLSDPRFTRGRLYEVLSELPDVGTVELAAMVLAAGLFNDKAQETAEQLRYLITGDRTPGPGRSDAFNVGAVQLLGWDLEDPPFANADFGVSWRAAAAPGDLVNWDGNSDDIHESNISVVLTLGASEEGVDHPALERVEAMLDAMEAPKYPFEIDTTLAEAGAEVYAEKCAECHARSGERFNTVISLDEIGTDGERAQITDETLVEAMHEIGAGFDWQFKSFRPSKGYVASRIDGAWLRGPFLHNGSVPTLWHLLSPVDERPEIFFRGGDVYDQAALGFMSDSPTQGNRVLFEFDTKKPGNGNGGHLFGTDLPDEDRRALLEYLKTI
ncbi:MAG: cytochrome c [Bradymonadia bacterium]